MKKYIFVLPLVALFAVPHAVSAHQHATYTIGGVEYQFTIGSLGEPVVVDDKSGVDLTITKGSSHMTMSADGDMDHSTAAPAAGLEKDLKVEISAGSEKKVLALSPVYGKEGSYKAVFYPTVATTLSYRFFGTINSTPVDITFTCTAEGVTRAADDTTAKEISAGVTQTSKSGGFGCPMGKEELGFPEKAPTTISLKEEVGSARTFGIVGTALALVALGAAVRRRNK